MSDEPTPAPDEPQPTIVDHAATVVLAGLKKAPLQLEGEGITHQNTQAALGQLIQLARIGLPIAEAQAAAAGTNGSNGGPNRAARRAKPKPKPTPRQAAAPKAATPK